MPKRLPPAAATLQRWASRSKVMSHHSSKGNIHTRPKLQNCMQRATMRWLHAHRTKWNVCDRSREQIYTCNLQGISHLSSTLRQVVLPCRPLSITLRSWNKPETVWSPYGGIEVQSFRVVKFGSEKQRASWRHVAFDNPELMLKFGIIAASLDVWHSKIVAHEKYVWQTGMVWRCGVEEA